MIKYFFKAYFLFFLFSNTSFANEELLKEHISKVTSATDLVVVVKLLNAKIESIQVAEDYFEKKATYSAKVVEVIKGDISIKKPLTFYAWRENNYTFESSETPKLIFLCKDKNGELYSDGIGTWFDAEPSYIEIAKLNTDKAKPSRSSYCEQ
jgi:hypothetical protein